MNWSKRQAVSKAQEAIDNYNEQIQAFTGERDDTARNADLWKQVLDDAHEDLAGAWIGPGSEQRIKAVSAVVPHANLEEVVAKCDAELEANRERVSEIANDHSYRDHQRLLGSEFPEKLKDIESRLDQVGAELEPFQTEEFQFLVEEKLHLEPKASGVRGIWEGITGKTRRKTQALEKVHEMFPNEAMTALVDRYEGLERKRGGVGSERNAALAAQASLLALVEEFSAKSGMIENYEEYRTLAVKRALKSGIEEMDLEAIIPHVGASLKTPLAKCVALRKKIDYAVDLMNYLEGEIEDRRKRVLSISGTQAKWRRYPKGSVPAKSKWLEDVPNMKREGTHKRTRWSRQSRECLHYYDDYNTFGNHLWHCHHYGRTFLAFDVFNHGVSHRMPYEGFTREVIPELAEYRDLHDQDGPPKELLDEHSQNVSEDSGEGEFTDEVPLEDCESDGFGLEDSESNDPALEDAAAEAIADHLDDYDTAASEDAS